MLDAHALNADEVIWAGVQFTIPPHWHIYWQNPGDSGIPTTFAWKLPEGVSAGDIAWPTPEPLEISGLMNYGYSDEVTLLVPLTVSRDVAHGTLNLTAKWLVCNETCIPETAEFSSPLPAATPGAAKKIEAALIHVPQPLTSAQGRYRIESEQAVTLAIIDPIFGSGNIQKVRFFPLEDGIIDNAGVQEFTVDAAQHRLTIHLKRGTKDAAPLWHGVLTFTQNGTAHSHPITAALGASPAATSDASANAPTPAATAPSPVADISFWAALALAFLGGLLLNIMPCVLPILALKALAIAKKAEASRKSAAMQGVSYTLGVVVSFLLIAGVMLALKASGAAIGWGFQLQNPMVVGVLAFLMLAVSANLLGLFELPVLFGTRASETKDDTFWGSFLTGTLAVLVATPCTAPFMATALGATLTFATLPALFVFVALGFGMAAPFLLISLWPALRRLLPKPGRWMQRFKQFLALPMLATALWLGWVLLQLLQGHAPAMNAGEEVFSPTRLEALRNEGTPVLVDATAAWCITCKVNERVALKPEEMQQFLREKNVHLLVADWTSSAPEITAYLASFGRNGVPLYVYYPPHGAPQVLSQILTPSLVRDAVNGTPK